MIKGGMGAKARKAALARLQPQRGDPSLLVVATGPYIGEGFDCPALDMLFLAAPVGYKGSIVQWAGRILRAHPGKTAAEIHYYHDVRTPVVAASPAQARTRLHPPRLPQSPPSRFYTTGQLMEPISV